jgi:hypothetical protein
LALPYERLYQDTSQHRLVLYGGINRAWFTSLRGTPSGQRRLCHLDYFIVCRILYSDRRAVDLEEGEWMEARTILAWRMGERNFILQDFKCWIDTFRADFVH